VTGVAIGIDVGTSGVRAALVDAAREPLAWGAASVAPERRREPVAWWDGVRQALAAITASASLAAVRAIAVDGTSGTVLAVDAAGTPLGEASLYNDAADADAVRMVAQAAPADSAARGATSPLAKLLALRGTPGMVRMLHQADWIAGQFCGRFDVSDANNALKTGYDPRVGAWPDWFSRLDVSPALLPEVVAPGTPIGRVAAGLGLPDGATVVAGTTDGCAAFLATGADAPGDAVTSLGSTLVVKLLSEAPVFAPQFGIYSHLVLGRWLAGGASNSGGAALLRHFSAEALATLSARIDPAQESGLDYYPLPAPGERFPVNDPALAPRETPRPADDAAFLHGLLEGVGRIEALGYRRLAELGAPALRSVRTVGGGARNPTWTALRGRMLGVPMLPARSEEAAVGTAGLALRA
jgi:sugar (pentulose or hexulose) kinase